MLELVRQLALTLESPVWEAVRKPAPWRAQRFSDIPDTASTADKQNVGYAARTFSEAVDAETVRTAYPTAG
jgi:nitrogenase molybdenum-cofactor synthesis protein NifE